MLQWRNNPSHTLSTLDPNQSQPSCPFATSISPEITRQHCFRSVSRPMGIYIYLRRIPSTTSSLHQRLKATKHNVSRHQPIAFPARPQRKRKNSQLNVGGKANVLNSCTYQGVSFLSPFTSDPLCFSLSVSFAGSRWSAKDLRKLL